MSGMYENVVPRHQRQPHSKRGWLVAIVVVAVVVLAACVYPVARALLHQYQYKQFLSALSSQTTQVYTKGNLRAEMDGTSLLCASLGTTPMLFTTPWWPWAPGRWRDRLLRRSRMPPCTTAIRR